MASRFYAVAALLLVLGVLGLSGSTPLFGVLPLTRIHSLVHIASAAYAGYAATRGLGAMRLCGKVMGFAYLALAIADFMMAGGTTAWLHLGLGAFFLYHALLAPPTL